ncbi:MAG: ribose-phosphate pyrophosphokinase [Proteobacteria bacterium]|nr:ribose-phosphate pyrophosphokinase [Pseudomonadota bacterium]
MAGAPLQLFALSASKAFGEAVAIALGEPLAAHEEREFEDGEHKARPLDDAAGSDVFVIQSTYGGPDQSANDKLCHLLFFIGALKDAGAARVTAVTPYLCYARKDRRTKPNDPVTTRYVAALFESVGTDRVVALEVHNPAAFENAFRCPTVALTGTPLFVDYVKANLADGPLAVVSPDAGGMKRAEQLREALQAALGCPVRKGLAEKYRSAGVVSGDLFAGDVAGATALIVDDLISTGGTLLRTARAARAAGATRVIALVTHGLFMAGSAEVLADPAIDRLVVSDSVPPFRLEGAAAMSKLTVLPAAPLVAACIRRLHANRGVSDLKAV